MQYDLGEIKHPYEIFDVHQHYGKINLAAGQPESSLLPEHHF